LTSSLSHESKKNEINDIKSKEKEDNIKLTEKFKIKGFEKLENLFNNIGSNQIDSGNKI
jgi:hypothetical protein